ncbi:MAG: hypothetical protein V2I33_01680 [Kangiellaceae bacterium]|jgi:hypothetical protein|nr:hypothetical protein [Kangiellaceae bacterium]
MDLAKYRKAEWELKIYATRYLLTVVLEKLKLKNMNQLSRYIAEAEGLKQNEKCSASFLYKKMKRSPIKWGIKVKGIEKLVPGISSYLTHPLWQVLSITRYSTVDAESLIDDMNTYVTHELYEEKFDMMRPKRNYNVTREIIERIARKNSPDALACLLALSKNYRSKLDIKFLEREAYRLFIRLVCHTSFSTVKEDLREWISMHFFVKDLRVSRSLSLGMQVKELPIEGNKRPEAYELTCFSQMSPTGLNLIMKHYERIICKTLSLKLIDDTPKSKMLFHHLLDNSPQGWIVAELYELKKNPDAKKPYLSRILKEMSRLTFKTRLKSPMKNHVSIEIPCSY